MQVTKIWTGNVLRQAHLSTANGQLQRFNENQDRIFSVIRQNVYTEEAYGL